MPNWVHIATKTVLNSVAKADLPEPPENYLEEPIRPPVLSKYWNIVDKVIVEMSQGEKDAVDAAEKAARDTAEIDSYDNPLMRVFLAKINVLETKDGTTPTTMDAAKAEAKLGN